MTLEFLYIIIRILLFFILKTTISKSFYLKDLNCTLISNLCSLRPQLSSTFKFCCDKSSAQLYFKKPPNFLKFRRNAKMFSWISITYRGLPQNSLKFYEPNSLKFQNLPLVCLYILINSRYLLFVERQISKKVRIDNTEKTDFTESNFQIRLFVFKRWKKWK